MRCFIHVLKAIGWLFGMSFGFVFLVAAFIGLSMGTTYVLGLSDQMRGPVFFIYFLLGMATFIGVMNCLDERRHY